MAIRGSATGIAVFVRWTVNAAMSSAFPPLVAAPGATPTLGLPALSNVGPLVFVEEFAPGTRGRTEDLEDDFRTHDAGHVVHEAPAGVRGR
jgi:major inositol transporter-like SP family MFS transporter